MKKTISVLLAVVLLCGMLPAASAADGARLYNVYADGMIFQQNAQAIFAGDAAPGERIEAVLKQPDGSVAARGMSSADAAEYRNVS